MSTAIQLPSPIAAYIQAANHQNTAAMLALFTDNAVVEDEGKIYRGGQEISQWGKKSQSEYQFTLEAIDMAQAAAETVVTNTVSGTFPGSPVTLRFHFTMEGDKITGLRIK